MRFFERHVRASLRSLHEKLDLVIERLAELETEERNIMSGMTDLVAEVTRVRTVDESVKTALKGVTDQLNALIAAGNDDPQLAALAADLKNSTDALAAAVVATPPA